MENNTKNKRTREQFEALRLTDKTQIPPIEPIISIHGSIYAIKGGLSMVTGITGSGKSTLLRLVISLALQGEKTNRPFDDLGIEVAPANGKPIIFLNTEVPDASLNRNVHLAVLRDLNINKTPHNFIIFNMINWTIDERRCFIKEVLEEYKDTHLLVLDGGADTISSVNDEVKALEAIEELNGLANLHKTTIVNVVHENKGNRLSRGHYGQQSERKSTGILSVDYDKKAKVFCVKAVKIRESAEFEPIYYHYNPQGNIEQVSAKSAAQRQAEAKDDKYLAVILEFFKESDTRKNSELTDFIARTQGVDRKTGQRWLNKILDMNYITQFDEKHVKCLIPIERAQQSVLV